MQSGTTSPLMSLIYSPFLILQVPLIHVNPFNRTMLLENRQMSVFFQAYV